MFARVFLSTALTCEFFCVHSVLIGCPSSARRNQVLRRSGSLNWWCARTRARPTPGSHTKNLNVMQLYLLLVTSALIISRSPLVHEAGAWDTCEHDGWCCMSCLPAVHFVPNKDASPALQCLLFRFARFLDCLQQIHRTAQVLDLVVR